jgi:hypothetical protein
MTSKYRFNQLYGERMARKREYLKNKIDKNLKLLMLSGLVLEGVNARLVESDHIMTNKRACIIFLVLW